MSYLVADAVEIYVQERERQLESIRRGFAEIESGALYPARDNEGLAAVLRFGSRAAGAEVLRCALSREVAMRFDQFLEEMASKGEAVNLVFEERLFT